MNGRNLGIATVVARDLAHDAAIVSVQTPNLPAITLGDSNSLEPGRQIGIVGYPIPDGFIEQHLGIALSLYAGRIASVRPRMLELDGPVIPGESGGPVFDPVNGKVVALSEARFEDERAIGLATPINQLKAFLDHNLKSYIPSLHT